VGDLASILKVDKKRQKVFAQQQNTSNDQTQNAFMIDRYKFLDLLPCSFNELKSMGYKNIPTTLELKAKSVKSNLSALFSSNIIQKELAIVAANEIKRSKFPVPDVTQMLPFKPIRNTSILF
jgi:cleavage stimulation factor subunit 3